MLAKQDQFEGGCRICLSTREVQVEDEEAGTDEDEEKKS